MNAQTIRGLVLTLNLGLIALVVYASYLTFFHLDPEKWQVQPPRLERYEPPALGEDPLGRNREVYETIFKVFEMRKPEPEPEPVREAPKPVVRSEPGDIEGLKVRLVMVAGHADAKSTVILSPASSPGTDHAFSEGMALDTFPAFSRYGGVVISDITQDEIVFTKDGKEYGRIPAKPEGGGSR